MKAIKILKKIYKNNPDTRIQRNNVDVNFTIHDFNNINEAIKELEELQKELDYYGVNYKCLKEQLIDECDLIKTNKEHFYFLKQNERDFIVDRFKSRFQLK